jgi:hypothetical protein
MVGTETIETQAILGITETRRARCGTQEHPPRHVTGPGRTLPRPLVLTSRWGGQAPCLGWSARHSLNLLSYNSLTDSRESGGRAREQTTYRIVTLYRQASQTLGS